MKNSWKKKLLSILLASSLALSPAVVLAGETENPAAEETVKEEAQAEEAGQAETEEVPEAAEENDGQIPAEQDEMSEPETTEVEDPDDRNDAKTSASDADSARIEDVQVTVEEDEADEEESAYAGDTYALLDVNAIGVVYLNSNRYADIKTYGGLQYYIMNGNEVYYKNGSSYELISVTDNYKYPKFTTASNSNLWNQPYYSGNIPAGELAKLYVKGGVSTAYSFALVYDTNGGSGAPESQTGEGTADSYDYTADAATPVREGYIYLGWAESASATSAAYQAGDTVTVSTSDPLTDGAYTKTLYAVWQVNTSDNPDDLTTPGGGAVVDKQVDKTEGSVGDEFTLTMEGYATAEEVRIPASETGANIVLLVDTSGSISGKESALKHAAQSLITGLPENSQVGVVTFDESASAGTIYDKSTASSIRFSSHADTSTYMANGLINAGNLLNGGAWTNTGNDKVVIVISDGIVADAENTLSAARQLNNAGIKIYCANVTGAGTADPDYYWFKGQGNEEKYGDNIMYAVSSQYADPQIVDYTFMYQKMEFGTAADGDYVYDADTTSNETWAGILNTILEEVVEFRTVNLGPAAVMKDQINTEYFDVSGITAEAKVWSYDPVSGNWTETSQSFTSSVDTSTGLVTVTGFDYASHWVSEDGKTAAAAGGQKLVLTISGLKAKAEAAGKTVDTNTDPQGLYEKAEDPKAMAPFTSPQVTIAEAKDFTIVHSSDGSKETCQVPDGPFDITGKVKEGYIYGGLSTDDTFKTPWTDKPGTELAPAAGETYYLREVSAQFLQPKFYYTYKQSTKELTSLYLITAVDTNEAGIYTKIGFDLSAGDTDGSQAISQTFTIGKMKEGTETNQYDYLEDVYDAASSVDHDASYFYPAAKYDALQGAWLSVQQYTGSISGDPVRRRISISAATEAGMTGQGYHRR